MTELPAESVRYRDIVQVVEESDYGNVNSLLTRQGWYLLSVGQDPHGVPRYVLGYTLIDGADDA